ncbi:MAG: glutamate racemase [Patescibacteria group bacterium]|nr:glutamate racemase [Patescibacteria group bacterium]
MPKPRTIGVFDSGVGGLSVAQAIEKALPLDRVIFKNDAEHVPYGSRTAAEILPLILPIFEAFIADGCEAIVVACNTVSTTLIDELRARFDVPLIAMEPMIKPAVQLTSTKVIAVCATPTTLTSPRYAALKQQYANGITVIEPDCSDWSALIENSQLNKAQIAQQLEPALAAGADVIVLGCTHYHWIEQDILALIGDKATVLQPEPAVISQLIRVLGQQS